MAEILGSIWRKWDLHLHTPASFDYHTKGVSFADLAKHLKQSPIDCFVITDHWTVDGYFNLLPHIPAEKLALPGIELRIDKTSKQKGLDGSGVLQAIVIFPNGTTQDEIKKKFLHQIRLCETNGKFITTEDIIDIGRSRATTSSATDEECYVIGCQQAYVDYKEVVQKAHEMNALVCLTYDKYGGFESIDPVNDSIFKSNLVKDADLMEVSKEEIQKDFYQNAKIIESCGKRTPCFNGSDAHDLSEIGRGGIWIKSEKSFRGLRQVLYFPKERISFAKTKPTYSYPRIRSVILEKHVDGHSLSSLTHKITFNDNLNAVIGHPSIGKSTFAETMALLFDNHTELELGEEKTKIENISSVNPTLLITAEVEIGTVRSRISRDFNFEYSGDISKDEFPIMYLNQGYIDRTARDPKAVSGLIEEKMENPQLESIWNNIEELKIQLNDTRIKYLRKFKLLESYKTTDAALSKVKKFFDISNSEEYKKLTQRMSGIEAKQKKMITLTQQILTAYNTLSAYEKTLSSFPNLISSIKELYPSIPASELSKLEFKNIAEKVKKIHQDLLDSIEKKQIEKEKATITTKMQKLLGTEGIHYSEGVLKGQQTKQLQLEAQLQSVQSQIDECDSILETHNELIQTLSEENKKWHSLDEIVLQEFNSGLEKVNIQYVPADKESWLVNILTHEAKQAWESFTPDEEKEAQKFMRPSEEDVKKVIKKIMEEKNISLDKLYDFLLECIDKSKIPIESDFECVRWLFGGKSEIIKDFLKQRLKEYAEKGEHQIYYMDKNISREGLSFTERSGALLEILLQKGTEPILLDQPEENLGSSYVTKKLINKLLTKKFERQIIIVSHNPNTVVLADSDLIIAFDKDPQTEKINIVSGAIEADGMREIICEIMEGGEEAFDLRAKRYKN